MGELCQLKGLGPKSEQCLRKIGIYSRSDLQRVGPARAFIRLKEQGLKPSLNFLYAMVGALIDKHWQDVVAQEKGKLLLELEGYAELKAMLKIADDSSGK